MTLTWSSVVAALLGTGLAAAVFTNVFAWVKEEIQRRLNGRRSASVLAYDLGDLLLRFARECSERAISNRYEDGAYLKMPMLAPYPGGQDRAALPKKIGFGLVDLRNQVEAASSTVILGDFCFDHCDLVEGATGEYIDLGYAALRLSDDLRQLYWRRHRRPIGRCYWEVELRKEYRRRHDGPLRRAWHRAWDGEWIYHMRRRIRRSAIAKVVRRALVFG